jgi:hypothetical protein
MACERAAKAEEKHPSSRAVAAQNMQKLKVINNKAHHFSEGKAEEAGMCVESRNVAAWRHATGPLNGWRAIPTAHAPSRGGLLWSWLALCIYHQRLPECSGMTGFL